MLPSNITSCFIDNKNVKELWFGGNKLWSGVAEYRELEYVLTNDKAKGINIGLYPDCDDPTSFKIELDYKITDYYQKNNTKNQMILYAGLYYSLLFGSFSSSSLGTPSRSIYPSLYNAAIYGPPSTEYDNLIDKSKLIINGFTANIYKEDGTQIVTYTLRSDKQTVSSSAKESIESSNIYLGTNSTSSDQDYGIYIYGCKVWNKGTLVRDMIPVAKREGDYDIPCLYDKVTHQYFRPDNGSLDCNLPKSELYHGNGMVTIKKNNQWRESTKTVSTGEQVYESFSNYYVSYSVAMCTVTVVGYTDIDIYIRSYAESSYDYCSISKENDSSSSWNSGMKASTKDKQSSSTYTKVSYTGLDISTPNTIYIYYGKDGSGNQNDDRGYFYIGNESQYNIVVED